MSNSHVRSAKAIAGGVAYFRWVLVIGDGGLLTLGRLVSRYVSALEQEGWLRHQDNAAKPLKGADGEAVKKLESSAIPLLASLQGGVAERFRKYREASAYREAGVVFR